MKWTKPEKPIEIVVHQRGCRALQRIGLECNCNSPGTIGGIVGDAGCKVCGRDNRNATHDALEMIGHLSHSYQPVKCNSPDELIAPKYARCPHCDKVVEVIHDLWLADHEKAPGDELCLGSGENIADR